MANLLDGISHINTKINPVNSGFNFSQILKNFGKAQFARMDGSNDPAQQPTPYPHWDSPEGTGHPFIKTGKRCSNNTRYYVHKAAAFILPIGIGLICALGGYAEKRRKSDLIIGALL